MTEFDTGQFTKWVVEKLNQVDDLEVVLSNPSGDSIFPCAVVSTPLIRIQKTENGTPIEIAIQISVDYWANTKYSCMSLSDSGNVELRELNLTRTNTTIDTYDDMVKKYRYGGNYETKYNALTGAFDNIR
jgi:hypothetical protein